VKNFKFSYPPNKDNTGFFCSDEENKEFMTFSLMNFLKPIRELNLEMIPLELFKGKG